MKINYKKLLVLLMVLVLVPVAYLSFLSENEVLETSNSISKEPEKGQNETQEKLERLDQKRVLSDALDPEADINLDNNGLVDIAGKRYSLYNDCALDIAKDVYSFIKYDKQGVLWLETRGYDQFYQSTILTTYHNYDDETLRTLAKSGDAIAMSRIAMNELFNTEKTSDKEVIKILEDMLIETGNFVALDLIVNNLPLTTEDTLEAQLNWVAVAQELNGLSLYTNPRLFELIQEHNRQWAKEKILKINGKRRKLGKSNLPHTSLDNNLLKEISKYHQFSLEQEKVGEYGVGC